MSKLSIVIPVFNEKDTLETILEKVENADFAGLEKEIVLVDDASTDGTLEILKRLEEKYKVLYHEKNQGKGAALRTGFAAVTGDIVAIQDADLEYSPDDYSPIIKLIVDGKADVVYGSRFMNVGYSKTAVAANYFGNKMLTFFTNLLYGAKLTDMETCYKAFKREVLDGIVIKSDRFDFEPEITAKILKKGIKIVDVPINYNGRKFDEGKKITWVDGVHAVIALLKFRFTD